MKRDGARKTSQSVCRETEKIRVSSLHGLQEAAALGGLCSLLCADPEDMKKTGVRVDRGRG
jgi:hypothetical protein